MEGGEIVLPVGHDGNTGGTRAALLLEGLGNAGKLQILCRDRLEETVLGPVVNDPGRIGKCHQFLVFIDDKGQPVIADPKRSQEGR